MKEVLHLPCWGVATVDDVLALAAQQHLPSDGDFGALFVSNRTGGLIVIAENDSDAGLVHTRLALLVHELGEISGADLAEIGNTKHETNGIQNIRLSGTIQPGDGIEMRIKPNA